MILEPSQGRKETLFFGFFFLFKAACLQISQNISEKQKKTQKN
jgi:hypothetical protein